MSKTLQLTLSGNRFICDCTTLWLKQWLLTRRRQILDIDQIICATGVPQGQVRCSTGSGMNTFNWPLIIRHIILTGIGFFFVNFIESVHIWVVSRGFIQDICVLWITQIYFFMALQTVIEIADVEFVCVTDMFPIIVSVSTVAAILALILIVLLLIYKYRGEIKIILYMKFGWHPFDCSDDSDIIGKVSRGPFY